MYYMELIIDDLNEYEEPIQFRQHQNQRQNQKQNQRQHQKQQIEPIPENMFLSSPPPMHQSMPKQFAKVVRPKVVQSKAPKISYDDILSKMGMFVSDGKLNLIDRNTLPPDISASLPSSSSSSSSSSFPSVIPNHQNAYIYNKYFKDEIQPVNTIRRPKTLHEYKMMLIDDYIQRHNVRQMKSTKLIMPTSNIHVSGNAPGSLNKFFYVGKKK